jgi:hypothetical protein
LLLEILWDAEQGFRFVSHIFGKKEEEENSNGILVLIAVQKRKAQEN